jgi:hypothetical protein
LNLEQLQLIMLDENLVIKKKKTYWLSIKIKY